MPRRPSSASSQWAESDLSVKPISTCFASLVTRGCDEARGGRVPGFALGELDCFPGGHARPAAAEAALDGSEKLADPCLRRVGPTRDRG